jgi:signal transduction histidine kinase
VSEDKVSVEEGPIATAEPDATGPDRRWDLFFAIVGAGVAMAAYGETSATVAARLVGIGAIGVLAVLYVVWGRRLVERENDPRAGLFLVAVALVFAVGTYAVTSVSYLLFGLGPLTFMVLPVRRAVPAVVAISLTPLFVAFVRDGFTASTLWELGPTFLVSAAISVWLGTWITRVVDQSRERARLIAELRDTRAEVARLSREAGVAAERERLAGEIHDTLAQGFTSIITLLQAADPGLRDERLALAVRTARENLAESRTLIAALAPSALAAGSLPDAVRRQATRFTEETGIPAICRVTGTPRELATATEVVLLRAAQEALANVRRHAAAAEVALLLAYGEDSVRLVVRDDGRGFDPAAASGFGLSGMRARAEQVHGRLAVRSSGDTGTTIELEVPQ